MQRGAGRVGGRRAGERSEQCGQRALVRRAQPLQRHVEDVLHVETGPVGDADARARQAAGVAHLGEAQQLAARDAHQRPPGRLAEQLHERREAGRQHHPRADGAGESALDEGLGEPAVGQVVRGRQHAVAAAGDEHLGEQPLAVEVDLRRRAGEHPVLGGRPLAAAELVAGLAEQQQHLAGTGQADRRAPGHVVEEPQHAHDRGRVDRHVAGGVVEADVAAGHRQAQRGAGVREAAGRLGELPHDLGVLRRPEVQAVGDGDRHGAGGGDVAVRLGERELRAGVRVEAAVAPVAVGRQRDAEPGLLTQPHDAGVLGPGENGVAEHDAVVLLGDPAAAGEPGARDHAEEQVLGDLGVRGQRRRAQRVEVGGAAQRALVHRALVGEARRRDVDDDLAVPADGEPVALDDLADRGGEHPPLRRQREQRVEPGGLDDRQHPLLRLAGEHLVRRHGRLAERNAVEVDGHAAAPGGRGLGERACQPGAAEVLDAGDQPGVVHLEARLDEQLLGERVADLHARPLGGAALVERRAGQHAHAADAVATGLGAEQDDHVADAARGAGLQPVGGEHAEAEGVDERVAGVRLVEGDLAADVGQAQAVAVAADACDDARQHAAGVGRVGRAEAERVHDEDRPRAHGEDVADDAADAGRGTLVRLDVRRVVVALDLERDGEALADVDDAGVLAHAGEHPVALRHRREPPQVDLAALVRAVLAPHDRVHRELGLGGAAAEHGADAVVLVRLEPEVGPGLDLVRGLRGAGDRVDVGGRERLLDRGVGLQPGLESGHTSTLSTLVKKPSPSLPEPVSGSTACSGCGMIPTTLPAAFAIPAMSRSEPFGLPPA